MHYMLLEQARKVRAALIHYFHKYKVNDGLLVGVEKFENNRVRFTTHI